MVGSLLWPANKSRPAISFAVNQSAKYYCNPRTAYWNTCKRILRYISSTQGYGILYSAMCADVTSKDIKKMPPPAAYFLSLRPLDVGAYLKSYLNADFAKWIDDRNSISGYALCQLRLY